MAKKIAVLFPYAPLYREAIYKLMDKELDVDWFFCGNAKRNLKMFDYSLLKHCDLSMEEKKVLGPMVYYKGIKKLNIQQYDAIICPGVIRSFSEWWLLQKLGKGMKDSKLYLWTHGWYGKESCWQKNIKKFFFRKVDGFFLYGDYARNEMIKEGFDASKLHVIKNSLDYDKQLELRNNIVTSNVYKEHFKNDNPTIIFIGRLTPVKKLNQIVGAVGILKQKGENYNIVFVGDGEIRQSLEVEVVKYQLQDNVCFMVPALMRRSMRNLFIMPISVWLLEISDLLLCMYLCSVVLLFPTITSSGRCLNLNLLSQVIQVVSSSTIMWKILLVASLSGLHQRAVVEKKSVKLAIKRLMIVGILIIS